MECRQLAADSVGFVLMAILILLGALGAPVAARPPIPFEVRYQIAYRAFPISAAPSLDIQRTPALVRQANDCIKDFLKPDRMSCPTAERDRGHGQA